MILIPELQTVVILVPRTGSGSLRRAIAQAYPQSMLVYRHMEACGVPQGYDRWEKIGVVREPVERLWSLYKFLGRFGGNHDPAYIRAMRASVQMPFNEWLVSNRTVFTAPYDTAGRHRFYPTYTVRHPLPENWKSQFMYLRPDLGTHIYYYHGLHDLADRLKVRLGRTNATSESLPPTLTSEAWQHVQTVFQWDRAVISSQSYVPAEQVAA